MSLGKKIELARREKDLSQEQLGKKIDKSRNTINRWEMGHTAPNQDEIELIAKATGKPASFFISENPLQKVPIQQTRIPLISWVSASRFGSADDPYPPGQADDFVVTTTKGENMFALKVVSDCMNPEFVEGDVIIINPHLEVSNNDFVVVKDVSADEATFKQFKIYGDKIVLHPLNHKYDDLELDQKKEYKIIGVVVEKVKRYIK